MWVFPWLFWFWFGLVLIAGFGGLCWIEFVVLFDCGLAGYVGWGFDCLFLMLWVCWLL